MHLLEKERKPWPLLFHALKLGFCHLPDALHVLEVGGGCMNTPKDLIENIRDGWTGGGARSDMFS